jgi:hypothetical protein
MVSYFERELSRYSHPDIWESYKPQALLLLRSEAALCLYPDSKGSNDMQNVEFERRSAFVAIGGLVACRAQIECAVVLCPS